MQTDISKVTEGLNNICQEVGVCPPSSTITVVYATKIGNLPTKEPDIIYAAELYKDDSKRVVRVAVFEDSCVSSCVLEDGKTPAPCCHTSDAGGLDLAKAWVEHLKANGYRVKEIPVER